MPGRLQPGDDEELGLAGADSDSELDEIFAGPLCHGCEDHWTWNRLDCSHEVRLHGPGNRIALFHPNWSSGTAGVRGTRILNNGRYYWEVRLSHRIFGTSMMVGVCTKKARIHADKFMSLIGEDKHGWALSHKGLLWHGGRWSPYTKPFRENKSTRVGVLYDGVAGTITFYKDGKCLGVAFQGLEKVKDDIYPVVCSTAARTEMTLIVMKRDFVNLQDRCRAVIVSRMLQAAEISTPKEHHSKSGVNNDQCDTLDCKSPRQSLDQLLLPMSLKHYLGEALQEAVLLHSMDSCGRSLRWHRQAGARHTYPEASLTHQC